MTEIEVTVRTTVNPTESLEKVEKAVRNVLGEINLDSSSQGDITILEGRYSRIDSLRFLRDLLRRMRIRDAAKFYLIRNSSDELIKIGLNKQAAYAGKISFCLPREPALGPIEVKITGEVDSIVKQLTD